jgi:hypothetical protein
MSTYVLVALIALAVIAILWRVLAPSLDRAVARAVKEEDIQPLVDTILQMSPKAQPDAFNHAIRRLWDDYQRPLAAQVVRALAVHHSAASIAQYWLQQVQSVEPELARDVFDREFLEAHYRPEVAATCGEFG